MLRVYDLWLPIVLSGLATHILSTLAWTVLPHHKPEWEKLPVEDDFYQLLAAKRVGPGQFMFPFAHGGSPESRTEEFRRKAAAHSGMLIIWPQPVTMGKAIAQTLIAFMVIAFVLGYLASLGLERGTSFSKVFQFVGTAGLLAHVSANFPHVFWFRRRIAMEVLDGVAFALVTAVIFAYLWPR